MGSKDTTEKRQKGNLPPTKFQPTNLKPQEQLQTKEPVKQLQLNQPKPKRTRTKPTRLQRYGKVGEWFQVLCITKVPIIGFIYILVLAVRKKTPPYKKSYAIAYILYRILVLALAITILYILYKVGLGFVDEILKYAGDSL